MPYTDVSPQQVTAVTQDGVEVSEVAALGDRHFAGDRHPCFIGLARELGGTYAEKLSGMTVEQGMRAAGLDYRVEIHTDVTLPHTSAQGGTQTVTFPTCRGTVGVYPDGAMTGLGMVGTSYKPIQNIEAAELGQAIVDESGATLVAAGVFGEPRGARTYMAFKLPVDLVLGHGEDKTDLHLVLINHHNGKGGLNALIGPIRRACTNQSAGTFGGSRHRFSFSHTGDTKLKILNARKALKITGTWSEHFRATMQRWLATPMSASELDAWLLKALPTPLSATEIGDRNWQEKRLHCKQVIRHSRTNAFGAGTMLGAYNGLVETLDHMWPTRSSDPVESAISRHTRILGGGELDKLKVNAARLLGVA